MFTCSGLHCAEKSNNNPKVLCKLTYAQGWTMLLKSKDQEKPGDCWTIDDGLLLTALGWALCFRSGVGLVLWALLLSRLIPGIY